MLIILVAQAPASANPGPDAQRRAHVRIVDDGERRGLILGQGRARLQKYFFGPGTFLDVEVVAGRIRPRRCETHHAGDRGYETEFCRHGFQAQIPRNTPDFARFGAACQYVMLMPQWIPVALGRVAAGPINFPI